MLIVPMPEQGQRRAAFVVDGFPSGDNIFVRTNFLYIASVKQLHDCGVDEPIAFLVSVFV